MEKCLSEGGSGRRWDVVHDALVLDDLFKMETVQQFNKHHIYIVFLFRIIPGKLLFFSLLVRADVS